MIMIAKACLEAVISISSAVEVTSVHLFRLLFATLLELLGGNQVEEKLEKQNQMLHLHRARLCMLLVLVFTFLSYNHNKHAS